ncbi:MAG: hypothetical protein JOZ81_03860 [Chloroflexi bacterium]|nr:hypothetical protein [Chloroflexota bacterium]MBV9547427.1 hypothetical protein [Chloroflexota bacterium]
MNVLPTRPGFGPIRTLRQAGARRWPALLGAAIVSAAIPAGIALADFEGQTNFVGGRFTAIEATSDLSSAIFATTSAQTSAIEGQGFPGVRGSGFKGGVGVEGQGFDVAGVQGTSGSGPGVQARSQTGIGLDASGGLVGISAEVNQVPGTSTPPTGSIAVAAGAAETGVNATGTKTAVKAFSNNGSGVDATSNNGDGVFATGHGQFGTGVLGSGDDVGVQGNGINVGVDGNSPNGDAVSGFSSIGGTGVFGESVNGLGAEFKGGEAPVRLDPGTTAGAPTSGTHKRGELYVDSQGQLFLCVADSTSGNAGTWKQVVLK